MGVVMATVIFWQNIPSIHQAPLISEFVGLWPGDVLVVTENDISDKRKSQGWTLPNYGSAQVIIAPTRLDRERLHARHSSASDVHVFSGIDAYPGNYKSFKNIIKSQAKVGLLGEAGKGGGAVKSFLRKVAYKLKVIRFSSDVDFVLGIGDVGVEWYVSSGFDELKVHSFMYHVERYKSSEIPVSHQLGEGVNFIFVGEIAKHKGLDLLFRALAKISTMKGCFDFKLRLVGTGPEEQELRKLALQLELSNNIIWLGTRPNDMVRELMCFSDFLVLPSRYDGWGAVINEALCGGTPVVVSDACGASCLIKEDFLGKVFSSNNSSDLFLKLIEIFSMTDRAAARLKIVDWAESNIAPEVGAKKLARVIEGALSL